MGSRDSGSTVGPIGEAMNCKSCGAEMTAAAAGAPIFALKPGPPGLALAIMTAMIIVWLLWGIIRRWSRF
jgi:hypothetical protein